MDGLTGIVPIVRVGGAILALSLPGFAILERLRFASELDGPFRVTIGVALGLSLHLILAMIGSALGLSLDILVWVAVALGIIGLMVTLPNRRAEGIMRSTGNWTGPFILGVALFAFGIASTRPMVAFSDAIDHVASVRAIDERENLEPNDVFYADGDGVTPDARKGFYHTWLATVSRISGLDPRTVWYAFRPWGLLLGLWAFSGLARELLASRNRVLLALVLYPLVAHGNAAWFLDTFIYPHNVNWLLIWSALALFVADLDGPDRGRQAALVVMAAALAPLHVFAPVLFLAAVEEYTAQQIAELLEWPRGTVLSMLHRTRRKLRETLKSRNGSQS